MNLDLQLKWNSEKNGTTFRFLFLLVYIFAPLGVLLTLCSMIVTFSSVGFTLFAPVRFVLSCLKLYAACQIASFKREGMLLYFTAEIVITVLSVVSAVWTFAAGGELSILIGSLAGTLIVGILILLYINSKARAFDAPEAKV